MITESESTERNASVIWNNFQKEIIDTHFRSVIEWFWTLMDNYEWEDGYKPKFGLYTMSYKKRKRVCLLKDSGEYYRETIENSKKYNFFILIQN
jgi:hypothetical protein